MRETIREGGSPVVKLQYYIGGLEGLPEPLSLEPLSVEKRVFVED